MIRQKEKKTEDYIKTKFEINGKETEFKVGKESPVTILTNSSSKAKILTLSTKLTIKHLDINKNEVK